MEENLTRERRFERGIEGGKGGRKENEVTRSNSRREKQKWRGLMEKEVLWKRGRVG